MRAIDRRAIFYLADGTLLKIPRIMGSHLLGDPRNVIQPAHGNVQSMGKGVLCKKLCGPSDFVKLETA